MAQMFSAIFRQVHFQFLLLGLVLLWALVDQKNRGWHDLAARTLLIKQV